MRSYLAMVLVGWENDTCSKHGQQSHGQDGFGATRENTIVL